METQATDRDIDLTEIINGVEVMGPSPFGRHQDVSWNLNDIISRHIKIHKSGKVYYAPLDVILKEGEQRLQPDLLFIRKENMSIFQDWVRGVPDMVCEIVSRGTIGKDTITKRDIYERYRVPEYWIVIPDFQTIEILTIEGDKYKIFSEATDEGIVKSKVIEGLEIDIKDVFQE
ncbi:MAG: Uma2 family endonuclease [Nitrospirae bacterium]|uniref:Uma2 family endonuclease n=1 Tax=Candidatus Magnetobacterium casense TaxID=1455061 RepID=UPI00058BB8BF|nr:Uma2 family endonuclease [Candidatus Magnetobacterium casensis]MBF0336276.1 Uma2 family endonuclease [Nitrospirota bacterium]